MEQAFQRILTEIYHIVSKKALAAEETSVAVSARVWFAVVLGPVEVVGLGEGGRGPGSFVRVGVQSCAHRRACLEGDPPLVLHGQGARDAGEGRDSPHGGRGV